MTTVSVKGLTKTVPHKQIAVSGETELRVNRLRGAEQGQCPRAVHTSTRDEEPTGRAVERRWRW